MAGRVEIISLAEATSGPAFSVDEVTALTGKGLEGDRIVNEAGGDILPKKQVTLIEGEAIDAMQRDYGIEFSAAESRRNICTRGIALNHLVGCTFKVGGTMLRGVELCEPCGIIERLSGKEGARKALIHRGGLRAEVVEGGVIRTGDPIEEKRG